MTNDIDLNDAFAESLLARVPASEPQLPFVEVDAAGDCIEVLLSSDSYYAERLDSRVTVYMSRDSGDLVGALVKGVRKIVECMPGLRIEITDGPVQLEYVFTASLWSHGHTAPPVVVHTYKKLRQMAEAANLSVDIELQEA